MAEIDPLILRLIVDAKDFDRTLANSQRVADTRLNAIEKSSSRMGRNVSNGFNLAKAAAVGFVASIGVDTIVQAIKSGLDYAASLGEVAQQLGVTTDALQEYRYAGSQAGLATEETDQALSQLTRRIGEAASGTKAQAEAFEKLGVSVKTANGEIIDAGDAIPLIAEALQKVESPAERAAILMDLFGRAGQKLEPLLAGGAKGVNGLRDAAQKLGIVLSSEQIQKADETADKLDAIKQVLAAKIAGTVADNADSILALANSLATLADKAANAGKEFQGFLNRVSNIQSTIKRGSGILQRNYGLTTGNPALAANGNRLIAQADNELAPSKSKRRGGVVGGRRGAFLAGNDFAGTGLADILGLQGLGASGAGTGANIKALGGVIDVFSQPAAKVAKKLDEWALELDRVAADVAVARAQLGGSPSEILAAEKLRIEANRAAEEATILGDAKNKSVRAQLISLNNENASIQISIAEREAANEASRKAAEVADQRLGQEIDALNDEGRTLALQASLTANREQRVALAKRMLVIQYDIERKELEAQIAAGKIADADTARARLKQRQLLDEQQLGKDNARPVAQYLDRLRETDFSFDAEKLGVDAIKDLNAGLADAIVQGGDVGDVLENSFKRAAAAMVQLALELLIVKPLLESLSGGGGISGIASAIGGLFGGVPGRASGGPVSAGRVYRVNEGVGKEFFRPDVAGDIIPLSKMNAVQGGGQPAQAVTLRVELSGDIDARIQNTSAMVAVEVVRAAEPSLTNKAVNETFRRGQRPSIGR